MTETIKYKGKEREVINTIGQDPYTAIFVKELNPMPELSVGDWYSFCSDPMFQNPFCHDGTWRHTGKDISEIKEIRFADGRKPWGRV